MSRTYRYTCSIEGTIYEERNTTPTVCVNDGAAISDLVLFDYPLQVDGIEVNSAGSVDFNNCTLLDISHSALADVGTNTHAQIDSHIGNASLHRTINDAGTATTDLWSASKIASAITNNASVAETLTSKTLTANTNNLLARGLWVNSGANSLSTYAASVPSDGQIPVVGGTGTTLVFQNQTGLTWRGDWNSGTAYVVNDVVAYAGSSYICISGHTNQVPPNATYWNVVASHSLGYYEQSGTSTISTTSATYVVMSSMTLTPAAGTYLVFFSSSGSVSNSMSLAQYAIHVNGVKVDHSERFVGNAGAHTKDFRHALHTQAQVTVTGSEAVDVRYLTSTSSIVVYPRSLILLKVA